jgi:hypothetical protein
MNRKRVLCAVPLAGGLLAVLILAATRGDGPPLRASDAAAARTTGHAMSQSGAPPQQTDAAPDASDTAIGPGTLRGTVLMLLSPSLSPELRPNFVENSGRTVPSIATSSFAQMAERLSEDVSTIIVDEGAVDDVDWEWMQDRFVEGRIIVGLNIPMGELLLLLSPAVNSFVPDLGWDKGEPSPFKQGEPFFSALASGGTDGACSTGFVDRYGADGWEGGVLPGLRAVVPCLSPQWGGA